VPCGLRGATPPRLPEQPPAGAPLRLDLLESAPFRELRSLALPADDLLIAGSAPLYLHGLRDHLGDLDVVAGPQAFELARSLGDASPAKYDGALAIRLLDGRLEITDAWFPTLFGPVSKLLQRAELVGDFHFLTLADTVRWKAHLDRPKDRRDLCGLGGRWAPPVGPVRRCAPPARRVAR
jgi:hypothetical protein